MSYPLCQALEHWPHQILKGGRRLLCANFADPMPAGVACSRGPVVAGAIGMSARHGPPPAARGSGAAPGLLVGHGPPPAARGYGAAPAIAPGLSTRHEPLRVARGRGPAVAVGLRWTCGPDSSACGQRHTTCSWRRHSQQPQRQQTQRFAGCA